MSGGERVWERVSVGEERVRVGEERVSVGESEGESKRVGESVRERESE